MRKTRHIMSAFAFLLFTFALSSVANAQATRTWVSGVGDDVNPCSRTAPCKTFAGAISKTAEGGEISVLDPGGFGGVTITKAITIDGAGTNAHILASGTNGIIINLTLGVNLATAVVQIRNITINGTNKSNSPGLNGIRWINTNGKAVYVENCVIENFNTTGIDIARAAGGDVFVKNTIIDNVNGTGINVSTSAGVIFASLDNVDVNGCVTGINGGTSSRVSVIRSTIARNTSVGAVAGNTSEVYISDSLIANNNVGAQSNLGGTLRLSNNRIHVNNTGVSNGGTCESDGQNFNRGNGAAGTCSNVGGF